MQHHRGSLVSNHSAGVPVTYSPSTSAINTAEELLAMQLQHQQEEALLQQQLELQQQIEHQARSRRASLSSRRQSMSHLPQDGLADEHLTPEQHQFLLQRMLQREQQEREQREELQFQQDMDDHLLNQQQLPRSYSRRSSLHPDIHSTSPQNGSPNSRRASLSVPNLGANMTMSPMLLPQSVAGSDASSVVYTRRGSVGAAGSVMGGVGRGSVRWERRGGVLDAGEVAGAVKALREALKEKRVDDKVLIEIMGSLTPEQCYQIAQAYKANYGVSLVDAFHAELSSGFGRIMVALATPLAEYDAGCLHDALSGIGTNDEMLMEVLVGRSNAEIQAIASAYKTLYGKDLESVVSHELSSDLKRFFIVLLQAQRDETSQFLNVEEDVESLFQAGKSKSKDASVFISTLCNRSDAHLLAVFEAYQLKHGMTIEELVRKEFKGDLEKSLMSLLHSIQNRPAHVATLFEQSLHGSTLRRYDEAKLIRLAVRHRHPRVMALVRDAYANVYGRSLYRRVEDAVSAGELRKVLLACIGLDLV